MNSGMIGKIEKAHRYAAQRQRFAFERIAVTVHGDNDEHTVSLDGSVWQCSCDFFAHHATCAHTMALELLLDEMLPQPAQQAVA